MADLLEVIFWSAAALNLLIAAALMWVLRRMHRSGRISIADAKSRFLWIYSPLGLVSALIWFFGWVAVLDLSTGHGEVVLAAPVLNLILGVTAAGIGRVVIGWKAMRW